MPKYRPEHEPRQIWGAGSTAKRGLSKPKSTAKNRQQADYADLEQPKPTWEMHRGEFLQHLKNLRKKKKRQKELKTWKDKIEKRQAIIDPNEFVKMITPSVLEEFNKIFGKAAQEAPTTISQSFMLDKFLQCEDKGYYTFRVVTRRDIDSQDFFATSFCIGSRYLERKDWSAAHGVFTHLVSDYLNDRGEIPHESGMKAIEYLRIISRAWIVAHASEYAGFDLKQFEVFRGRSYLSKIAWSASAVIEMEKIGELQDLPSIRIIGLNCWEGALEGYCSRTSNQIRIKEGLRLALRGMKREGLLHAPELSDEQLVYRLSFLFKELGLGGILTRMPYLARFGGGSYGFVAKICDERSMMQLLSKGLDQEISLTPASFGTGVDAKGPRTAEEFLEKQGIVRRKDPDDEGWRVEYLLTEKGKELVARLMQEIRKTNIEYDGKLESPLVTLAHEIFG